MKPPTCRNEGLGESSKAPVPSGWHHPPQGQVPKGKARRRGSIDRHLDVWPKKCGVHGCDLSSSVASLP